jgi:hypothetical protein
MSSVSIRRPSMSKMQARMGGKSGVAILRVAMTVLRVGVAFEVGRQHESDRTGV